MIRLLCFDLDGTLIDSANDIVVALNRTLVEYGRLPMEPAVIISHIGNGLRVLLQGVLPEVRQQSDGEEVVQRFFQIYEEEMTRTTTVYPGIVEFLEKWDGQMAIITNKNELPTLHILRHLGLDRLPWLQVIGADTLSEKKPSPLGLRTVMAKAGVRPDETLMIGDGTPDMESAQAAGVGAIALGFGYTPVDILNAYSPLRTIQSYAELPAVIASLAR